MIDIAVLIIAEAGVNHNGNVNLAKQMIVEAAATGADIIKFQTFNPSLMVSKFAQKADYQKKSTDQSESQLEMLEKLALKESDYPALMECCKQNGIAFLSTPFDHESIDFLVKLGMPFWKVPSGEITNYPYLVQLAQTQKPIVLSTGMCTIPEIEAAVNLFRKYGCNDIQLLHCNTEYPTPFEDVNLNAMATLKNHFQVPVGYSDHTQGIEVSIAAVAMGAQIIEKHFTLDNTMEGPDHKASLEPHELKKMIQSIRNIEKALGDGEIGRAHV